MLPEDGATINRNLRAKPDYHVVPQTAHFAFTAPCSADQTKALPEICIDSSDFDRIAFHKDFNATVLAFFRKHLYRNRKVTHGKPDSAPAILIHSQTVFRQAGTVVHGQGSGLRHHVLEGELRSRQAAADAPA